MTIAVPVYFIMAVYFIPLARVCPSKYIVGANVAFDKGWKPKKRVSTALNLCTCVRRFSAIGKCKYICMWEFCSYVLSILSLLETNA